MTTPDTSKRIDSETGGITILVALMLLVLLTIAAVGMSRNSFREIVTTGFVRQGAMARNVADSGIEWSIQWIDLQNAPAATGASQQVVQIKAGLLENPLLAGKAKDITSSPSAPVDYVPGAASHPDFQIPGPSGVTQGFTVGLTLMGKLPIANMSQGVGSGAFAPATGGRLNLAPDLWGIRSDAQVTQGSTTFIHAKELWISTPVQ